MSDRFDFEQQLLDCWNVTTDLKTVLKATEGLDASKEDDIQNMLIGMIALYDHKFNELFSMFEQQMKEKA